MIVGGLSLNRVHEILQRMIDNPRHIESLKTCCGVLAILSRDEANKQLIARDGVRLICNIMDQHIERHDLLEAACDLLWSLAFNNTLLKEVIGQQGAIPVILRGMNLHPGVADFLKSACGALSNMCQNPANQSLIAADGGIQCMLGVLEHHRQNVILLPFVFDALASLIVGNQDNGRRLSEAGAIVAILGLMEQHLSQGELVKSGCHALAILSDNRGEGSKIATAGGVKVLLPVLRMHPAQVDLHRVAAVVLLRMLQEAPVAAEMARNHGVPLMLNVLFEQMGEVETVAAGCHILYSITHAEALKGPPPIDLEAQFQLFANNSSNNHGSSGASESKNDIESNSNSQSRSGGRNSVVNTGARAPLLKKSNGPNSPGHKRASLNGALNDMPSAGAGTLALVLAKHTARKDVARACVRSVINLSRFPSALSSFIAAGVLEPILTAVSLHPGARDITEGALTMLKLIGSLQQDQSPGGTCGGAQVPPPSGSSPPSPKRINSANGVGVNNGSNNGSNNGNNNNSNGKDSGNYPPLCSPLSPSCVPGMLACVKARPGDATAATIIFRHLEAMLGYNPSETNGGNNNGSSNSGGNGNSSGNNTGRLRNSPRFNNNGTNNGSGGANNNGSGANGNSSGGAVVMSSWEQEGVKVCLTWARLHSQSASAPSDRASSSSSSASSSAEDMSPLSPPPSTPNSSSSSSSNNQGGNGTNSNNMKINGGKSSVDAKALATALSALCRFLQGFASRLPPGLAALRMLDTSTIVRNLEARVRVELNGEIDSEVRRSVNMLLVLLGSPPPPAVSPALAAAAAAAAATGGGGGGGSNVGVNNDRPHSPGKTQDGKDKDSTENGLAGGPGGPSIKAGDTTVGSRNSSRAPTPLKLKDPSNSNSGSLVNSKTNTLNPDHHLDNERGLDSDNGNENSNHTNIVSSNNNSNNGSHNNNNNNRNSRFTKSTSSSINGRGGRRNDKSQENMNRNKDSSIPTQPDKNIGCIMVDADMVDPEGYVVSEAQTCRCRHGHRSHVLLCQQAPTTSSTSSTSQATTPTTDVNGTGEEVRRILPKRPRPLHPSEQGMDRTLLWVMPPTTEPMSPSNCGDPDSAALLAEENDDPSIRRCHVVYSGCDAAGLNVNSKVSIHEPYDVPLDSGIGEGFKHSLTFDACFESGNLYKAIQRNDYEYDLFLRPDIHTEGHMQWFYFAVANTHPPEDIKDLNNNDDNDSKNSKNSKNSKDGNDSKDGTLNENFAHEVRSSAEAQAMIEAMIASPTPSSPSSQLDKQGDIHLGGTIGGDMNGNEDEEEEEEEDDEDDDDLVEITFNVVNLTKPDSLFNHGMQPLMFDCEEAKQSGQGWCRAGYDISYFANNYNRKEGGGQRDAEASSCYYTLTFTVTFSKNNSTYLLTNSYPYTYSDHKYHLSTLLSSNYVKRHMSHSILCQSLGELDCDILTITEDGKDEVPLAHHSGSGSMMGSKRKKCIVITGRVHPGETQASWMMKGVLDFLTGDSPQARLLRSLFVFKIVPMLNPDGVMYGSNRCSLAGCDLNRAWKKPSRNLHPTIYFTKSLIRTEKALRDVVLYIDLHGHSRKMNVFMYGCDDKKKPRPMTRIFPKLLSWNVLGKKYLSFQDCSFTMRKGRESTARVVVAKELGILNSYTLEGTFAGPNFGPLKDMHMNSNHFQEMGHALCDTLLDYYIPNREQGLLSEEVGNDGIALNGRCAHSLNKHAKAALRRYVLPTDISSPTSLPSSPLSTNADVNNNTGDIRPSSSSSSMGHKNGNSGGQDNSTTSPSLRVNVNEESKHEIKGEGGGGLKGNDKNGINKDHGAEGGYESPNENGNDKDDEDLIAPPSPEVLATVATDPDGSPSNTKVLQALLSENVDKATSRRRQSIHATTGEIIEIEIEPGEDDDGDDIDSGSDNGFDDNNSITEALTPTEGVSMNKLRSSEDQFDNLYDSNATTANILAGAANALTTSKTSSGGDGVDDGIDHHQDSADEIEESIHIQTSTSEGNLQHLTQSSSSSSTTFRRHSSSSKLNSSSLSVTSISSEAAVIYPQLFPAAAPPSRMPNPVPPFSGGNVSHGNGGGRPIVGGGSGNGSSSGQAVVLPRTVQRTSSNNESIWSSSGGGGGGGGGGSLWADTVGESGMLVSGNSRKSPLLSVGSTTEGTTRPRSGSRYRPQGGGSSVGSAPSSNNINTNGNTNTLTQLTNSGFDGSTRGLPSVSLSVNGAGGDQRVTMSRPPRPSSLPTTALGSGGSVGHSVGGLSGGGGISISSSRGPAASISTPTNENQPVINRTNTMNVMRGSLRVRDTTPTLAAPGISPKVGTESMTAAQRLSFRRMNSGQIGGPPKGASLLNNSTKRKGSRRTGRPGK